MKKVLMVTYYFPPSGGPGVQRVLKFAKYLPQFGWHPVVLTVENGNFPARDESLLAEIPTASTVYRTKIFEPYELYRRFTGKSVNAPVDVENIPAQGARRSVAEKVAEFIRSTLFIPDARIGWYPYAIRKGMEIIKKEKIDALYSSSPPYTCALIARTLHLRTGLPWIAGFRDPWTGFLSTPDRWLIPRKIDERMERAVFEDANLIEAAWSGIIRDFRTKFPDADFAKCVYLPNGFDPPDYPKFKDSKRGLFTVVYTGSMYGRRNPATFLRAVEELVGEKRVNPGKILLKFIGRFGSDVHAMFSSSSIRESIEVVSYIPHTESINELLRADALLLIVDEANESEEIVPGKVFEYIGARRPIIAVAPQGAVSQLMKETKTGLVARNKDVSAIKAAFLECYRNFHRRKSFQPNIAAMKQYERKEITRRLSRLLDSSANQLPLRGRAETQR